mmetsp:Transcript_33969/g.76908  ORF Transcript_33969/g.76908 Transcript_33969/m.76908 type:complete len:110 (-) Transcript_33969:472-801(-)
MVAGGGWWWLVMAGDGWWWLQVWLWVLLAMATGVAAGVAAGVAGYDCGCGLVWLRVSNAVVHECQRSFNTGNGRDMHAQLFAGIRWQDPCGMGSRVHMARVTWTAWIRW